MSAPASNGAYDEWLDALAEGEGYALVCPDGHGGRSPATGVPGMRVRDALEEALAETGTVETYSVVHVAGPQFADDTPYVNAIADFGPVRLTGVLRGIDPATDAVEIGDRVAPGVEERVTDGEPLVVFRPADGE